MRHLVLLIIGLPIQIIVYIFAIPVSIWFRSKTKKPQKYPWPEHQLIPPKPQHKVIRDGLFTSSQDDHNAFMHIGFWARHPFHSALGLNALMSKDGSLIRRRSTERGDSRTPLSGDCLIFWLHGWQLSDEKPNKGLRDLIIHYLKNLGLKDQNHGFVSARCSNFGVNIAKDGAMNLSQPCLGPSFFQTSALLTMAATNVSRWYWIVYWLHWLLFGGWLWMWCPFVAFKPNQWGYVRDVTTRALWLEWVNNPGWRTYLPLYFMCLRVNRVAHPHYGAMIGRREWVERLPTITNMWIAQTISGKNKGGDSVYHRDMFIKTLEISEAVLRGQYKSLHSKA